jgi:ABC-type amino acid transport substrate-binding protein
MNKLEIFKLLEEAYDEAFLDSILLIGENKKEYKKSDFYKTTRIPFLQLYKMYYEKRKADYGIVEQFDFWLRNLNEDTLEQKIAGVLKKLKEDEDLKEIFDSFSLEGAEKEREELEKNIETLKE